MEWYTWYICPWMFLWMVIYNHCVVFRDSLVNNYFMVFNYWGCVNYCLMLNWGLLMNCVHYCWSTGYLCLRMNCWRLSNYGCLLGMYFLNVGSRVNCLSVSYCCCFLDLRVVLVVDNMNLAVSFVMVHFLGHLSVRITSFTVCTCYIQ